MMTILMCAQKLTDANLIYRTGPKTKTSKMKKLKKTDMLGRNGAGQETTMMWQWHQLDHMQVICTSLQRDNHTSTLSLKFYYSLDAFHVAESTVSEH